MEHPRPEMDEKWDSKTYEISFSFFFSDFLSATSFKVSKKCSKKEKNFLLQKFGIGIRKCLIRCWVRIRWKKCKKKQKKLWAENFCTQKEKTKTPFFCHFFARPFFNRLEISIKFFDTHIAFLKINCVLLLSTFWSQPRMKWLKKRKTNRSYLYI